MEKKVMKMYKAPVVESVEMEVQGILCASTNADDVTTENPGTVF